MNDKPEPSPDGLRKLEPHSCSYCGHVYIKICDGREDCPNRVWLDEAKRRSSEEKRKELTKEAIDG